MNRLDTVLSVVVDNKCLFLINRPFLAISLDVAHNIANYLFSATFRASHDGEALEILAFDSAAFAQCAFAPKSAEKKNRLFQERRV